MFICWHSVIKPLFVHGDYVRKITWVWVATSAESFQSGFATGQRGRSHKAETCERHICTSGKVSKDTKIKQKVTWVSQIRVIWCQMWGEIRGGLVSNLSKSEGDLVSQMRVLPLQNHLNLEMVQNPEMFSKTKKIHIHWQNFSWLPKQKTCKPAITWGYLQPFFPYGLSATIQSAATLSYAFIGYDVIANAAEESENPSRDLPRAMISALMTCAFLYVSLRQVFGRP